MITYAALCHAVADVFRDVEGIKRVEAFDEIEESVSVFPTLHVYPDTGEVDDANEKADRATFGAGVRVTKLVIKVDGYAQARSHLKRDLKDQMALVDRIDATLSEQVELLYGLEAVHAHRWHWETGTLPYNNKHYAGVVFTITLTVY